MDNNVNDVALIFEGGGMRNSYSSGMANVLLGTDTFFGSVYGLSAGATNAADYVSRDLWRSKVSFTEFTDDLVFRRFVLRLLHREDGRSSEAHAHSMAKDHLIPFDLKTFRENPAQLTLSAIDRDTGETTYFTKERFTSSTALMRCIRASTSFPILMPPTEIDGRFYYDGGIGDGGGIMLPRASADGFKKFFVVCTHHRGFRKSEKRERIYDAYFWRRPHMRELMDSWDKRYNAEMDHLDQLEAEGKAYVFYADEQSVTNTERDMEKLRKNYIRGLQQAKLEYPAWRRFLGLPY